jgi:hypothetical protein
MNALTLMRLLVGSSSRTSSQIFILGRVEVVVLVTFSSADQHRSLTAHSQTPIFQIEARYMKAC